MAYIARRVVDDQMEIQINPGILIQETQAAALQEAGQAALTAFLPTEGWIDHKMIWVEIEQGTLFDTGQRLMWQIVEPDQSTEETHGPSETTDG